MAIESEKFSVIFQKINDMNNSKVKNEDRRLKASDSDNNEETEQVDDGKEHPDEEKPKSEDEKNSSSPAKKESRSEENKDPDKNGEKDEDPEEDLTKKYKFPQARMHFPLYIISWLLYFFLGVIPPFILGTLYFYYVLIPHFFTAGGPQTWDTWLHLILNPVDVFNAFLPILQNPFTLFIFLTIPFAIMGLHLLKMFDYALIVKFYLWCYNKIRPSSELKNALPFGETRPDIEVYHARNFILKVIKWEFLKSPYPWLLKWMYNFVGSNKIAKSATIEEGYVSTEFLEVGENAYVGYGTVTTAHLVEGGYGALTLKKIKIGDNACVGPRCAIPPGAEFDDDAQLLWHSGVIKYQKVRKRSNYWGLPASRLSRGRYRKVLKMPKEEYEAWKKKRKKAKSKKKKAKSSNKKDKSVNKKDN